ncbi:hypothetical protein O1611_g5515 [Lasiodiplodia mahajangana]|uniref:Uncharacterized protein n=1 Tax=Lasiodiplodia mahajangana TaxID=1108764 RepID=A0ACC2JKR0_9PEZI|nr:hypothetical protein O1611_g5515 [Lasiodiplodia mahajangana]
MDPKDAPLQPSSPAPSTMRRSTVLRQPSGAQVSSTRSVRGPPAPALRRPLQPDMSFGNSGSSQRLFRRVPSDGSNSGRASSPSPFDDVTDENKHPNAVEVTSKEAILGRRLYSKALDPALAELHAQTSSMAKREALAKLSEAFAALDAVDPEGAYHFFQNINSTIAQDNKLSNAFLNGLGSLREPPDSDKPHGTVIIKNMPVNPSPSPTKLVLAANNPHLKSHRRRQSAALLNSGVDSTEKVSRPERDPEKAALQAKYPGCEPQPGMEHCKQLSDVLYSRWVDGLRLRWPGT